MTPFDPQFKARPLSWSQISQFEYGKDLWYETYILGKRQSSKEMDYGKLIDERFQKDPTFFPEIPRGELLQHRMTVSFNGLSLVGVPDILSIKDEKLLADLKTGKKKWDKKRADETGQLTFYLLLLYITYKIKPEEFKCFIAWLPTKETGDFKIELIKDTKPVIIETSRTMHSLLLFGERINKTVKEMQEFYNSKQ